jgi:hypothetical protein
MNDKKGSLLPNRPYTIKQQQKTASKEFIGIDQHQTGDNNIYEPSRIGPTRNSAGIQMIIGHGETKMNKESAKLFLVNQAIPNPDNIKI